MREIDLHYAAGLFDGEGSITLTRRAKCHARHFAVSLSSTDKTLTDFMAETFGGRVYSIGKRSARQKPIFHWFLKASAAVIFLKAIAPLLREQRKRQRANLVLLELAPLLGDHSRNPETRAKRTAVEEAILAI